MAEHSAVNRRVVSSSLTCGANFDGKIGGIWMGASFYVMHFLATILASVGARYRVIGINSEWLAGQKEGAEMIGSLEVTFAAITNAARACM